MTAKVGKYETNLVKKPEVPKAPHGTWHQGAPWTLDRIGSMESLTVTLGRNVKDGRLNTIFGVMGFAFICFVAADPENLAGHFSFLC